MKNIGCVLRRTYNFGKFPRILISYFWIPNITICQDLGNLSGLQIDIYSIICQSPLPSPDNHALSPPPSRGQSESCPAFPMATCDWSWNDCWVLGGFSDCNWEKYSIPAWWQKLYTRKQYRKTYLGSMKRWGNRKMFPYWVIVVHESASTSAFSSGWLSYLALSYCHDFLFAEAVQTGFCFLQPNEVLVNI